MASISNFTMIDGENISRYVLLIKSDMSVDASGYSGVQQCDLILANPHGIHDGKWSTQSILAVVLISKEYISEDEAYVYPKLIFTGRAQKIDYQFLECHIRAGCDLKQTSGAILYALHEHKGQTVRPVFDKLSEQYNLVLAEIQDLDIKKREWFFKCDQTGRGTMDDLSRWDGCCTYIDESNRLHHKLPYPDIIHPSLTGRMKAPESSQSTIAHCNRVCVRGGSWKEATDPGSEHRSTNAIMYTTTDDDLAYVFGGGAEGWAAADDEIKNNGIIKAPDFIFPELTTPEQCRKRAINLLANYVTQLNVSFPGVIARSPELLDIVTWQTRRQTEDSGWVADELQSGQVCRRKDEVSGLTGWVTYLEVHPFLLGSNVTGATGSAEPGAPKLKTFEDLANGATYKSLDGNYYRKIGGDWGMLTSGPNWVAIIALGPLGAFFNSWQATTPPSEVLNNYNYVLYNGTNPNPEMVISEEIGLSGLLS